MPTPDRDQESVRTRKSAPTKIGPLPPMSMSSALVHLHTRLKEIGPEARPSTNPRTVINWTTEDLQAVRRLVGAMMDGLTDEQLQILIRVARGDSVR